MLAVTGSAPNPLSGLLLQLTENLDGFGTYNANTVTPGVEQRGYAPQWGNSLAQASKIFGASTGTVAVVYDAPSGRTLGQMTSAFPYTVISGGTGVDVVKIPAGVLWDAATSLPVKFQRPRRKYTLLVPVRAPTPGTQRFEFAIAQAVNLVNLNAGTGAGAGFTADPAVNGGAYTCIFRPSNGGGLVNGFNTGIVPNATDWHELGMRYSEGPNPKLEWLFDGIPVQTQQGDAQMLRQSTSSAWFYGGLGCGNAVGSVYQKAAAQFIVQEL